MKKITHLFLFIALQLFTADLSLAQTPVAAFTSSTSTICSNDCINFIDNSTNATSWKWIFPGATPATSSDQNPYACYLTTGSYDVTLIAINGANSDTLTKVGFITVNPTPLTPVITEVGNMLYCSVDPSYTGYQWYYDTTAIPGAIHAALMVNSGGNYNVLVKNSFGCSIAVGINVYGPNNFGLSSVQGTCFIDYNKNNIRDNGEPGYAFARVTSVSSGNSTWYGQADSTGFYIVGVGDTGTIQTSLQNGALAYTFTPAQHTSYFSGLYQTDSVDFALTPIPGIHDLRIYIIPVQRQRVGNNVVYRIQYYNAGTDTVANGDIVFIKNPKLDFVSAVPANSSINGDSVRWNYTNLLPNELRAIDVTLYVTTAAGPHEFLTSSAMVEPATSNAVLQDSYATVKVESITSHDPNDKAVLTGDSVTTKQIADGIYLTYMIRFQNTGNDTAFKIVILDTLDNNLDPTTLDVISSSHKYDIKADGSRNITFTFNNVLLPDSTTNSVGSNGYICYRVKPKGSLEAGAIVKNKAYIYFDYNAAVPTNVALTNVVVLTGLNQPQQDAGFMLFPNPAAKKLYLVCSKQAGSISMRIYNLPGEVCYQSIVVNPQSEIDISSLPAGVYFVEVNGGKGKWVGRFVKE